MLAHLASVDALRVPTVGVFVADDGEPDLMPLISSLQQRGHTVALPTLQDDPNDFSMHYVPWRSGEELCAGRYGIPVPCHGDVVEPDTVLVSLVGFDSWGNRIGRGGGFFDRYLARTTASVVGVAFEAQRFVSIPIEPHDVALPTIVTDRGVRFLAGSPCAS